MRRILVSLGTVTVVLAVSWAARVPTPTDAGEPAVPETAATAEVAEAEPTPAPEKVSVKPGRKVSEAATLSAYEGDALAYFTLGNKARVSAGLDPFKRSEGLDAAAEARARDMLERGYFAHADPEGIRFFRTILAKTGYTFGLIGENLARRFGSADAAFASWMASPGHRKNLLEPKFTHTGIWTDGNLTVQLFGELRQ